MIHLFPLETLPNLNDSNILAPAGGIGLLLWFLYQAAKHYKEGRRIDVAAAEERERQAELRADNLENDLRKEIGELKTQINEEKRERNSNEAAQELEIKKLRRRVNTLSRDNFNLRQLIITTGNGEALAKLPLTESPDEKEEDQDG